MDLSPLIYDAVFGFAASVLTRSTAVSCLAWLTIPAVVGVVSLGPRNFFAGGENSMVWLGLAYLLVFGFLASGLGMLLGYLLRRSTSQRS